MKGYVSLLFVLVLSGVISLILFSSTSLSIRESTIELKNMYGAQALSLANLCGEVALMKLQSVLNYGGDETIEVEGERCEIRNIGGQGQENRTIQTQSSVGGMTRRIKIEVGVISPVMRITSWEEVPSF